MIRINNKMRQKIDYSDLEEKERKGEKDRKVSINLLRDRIIILYYINNNNNVFNLIILSKNI